MLELRAHHILDIVRNIGNNRPRTPHEYGHLVHIITEELETNPDQECKLVIKNDAICGPCKMLTGDGLCNDILPQLENSVSKQTYNDSLDAKLMQFLGLEENTVMPIRNFLMIIDERLEEIVPLCTHPKEEPGYRKNGLRKGLDILGIGK